MKVTDSAPHDAPSPAQELRAGEKVTGTPPPSVPDYGLLRRIGGGAYGDVWLARSATGVLRAVKIVWRHTFEDDRPFQREFEGIQHFERLSREHPSQLALFHVGRNEAAGCFYYVMELADDVAADVSPRTSTDELARSDERGYTPHTLRTDLGHGRLPAARVLEIGLALTEALSHLHTNGLVHRDVKPSNIIFVGGKPKLADIGLVTDAGDTRSIVGTEGYLAPEGPGTAQADLFALGKVLYETATGLDRRQLPQLPPDLRDWPDAKLVFELNEIILRACETDPNARYQTAEEMASDLTLLQRGQSVKSRRTAQRRWAFTWKTGVAVAAVVLAAAVGWQLFYGLAFHRLSAPISRPVIPREAKVIAVLPFDNESLDKADSYLGKQMAEELSTALSRITTLRVLGRDSAAALKTAPDRRAAAQQFKLSALLDGHIEKSGNQLRLAVQLVHPADGLVLWSDVRDGEMKEVLNQQSWLAQGVVKALTGKLTDSDRALLAIKATKNPEAHQLFLEGRDYGNDDGIPLPENWPAARARFQAAIDLDPRYAAAYAGLAAAYHAESRDHHSPKEVLLQALAAAEKAVALDDTLAEAHGILAWTKYRLYDWEDARKEFEIALQQDPNLAGTLHRYARYLTCQGRFAEAIARSRRAAEIDPGSMGFGRSLAWRLFDARRYDEAQKAFEAVLQISPNHTQVLDDLAWCQLAQGRQDHAIAQWTRHAQTSAQRAALLQAYRQAGMAGFWRVTLAQSLERKSRGEYVDPYWLAADYAKAGDADQAFEWLEHAYEQHRSSLPLVAVEYRFFNLHSDPRFPALLKKLGLKMPVWNGTKYVEAPPTAGSER